MSIFVCRHEIFKIFNLCYFDSCVWMRGSLKTGMENSAMLYREGMFESSVLSDRDGVLYCL